MANEENLTPFKSGKEWKGNAKGRPPMKKRIAEMQEQFGDAPREELMKMANNGNAKFETRARILMHLDDKFTGRAPQNVTVNAPQPITEINISFHDKPAMKTINGSGK